jgi:hypothetical protein
MGAGSNIAFHNGYRSGWSGIGVSQMPDRGDDSDPAINHADAPQDVLRRFGTDLAQWDTAGELRLITAGLRQIIEMNCNVSLTLNPMPKRSSALQRPKV